MELRGFFLELRGSWCGTEEYVKLKGFWCGTEGVELRYYRFGTEGVLVLQWCGPCVEPMC